MGPTLLLALPLVALLVLGQRLGERLLAVRGLGFLGHWATTPVPAAWPRRLLAQAVGVLCAYLAPVAVFAALSWGRAEPGTLVTVAPGYPAALAGVRDGDRVLSVDGAPVTLFRELKPLLAAGRPSRLELQRGPDRVVLAVTPDAAGLLGVKVAPGDRVSPPVEAQVLGALLGPARVWGEAWRAVGTFSTGGAEAVGGPVALVEPSTLAARLDRWLVVLEMSWSMDLAFVLGLFVLNAALIERRARA